MESPIVRETYVSVAVLAQRWGISVPMVRTLFRDETEGVFMAPPADGKKPRLAMVTQSAADRLDRRIEQEMDKARKAMGIN